MEPLVSILIPAYNAQRTIAQTLRSAIGQQWRNKEIIVVDDGSTDGTCAVVQSFASHGVTLVRQRNQGAAEARNTAFAHSRGDYIQWLDADDLLGPDKIKLQIEALRAQPSQQLIASGPWARFFHRLSRARFVPSALWNDLPPREWLL